MGKFDRIVREALVMGGQARIRDTEITVNEIVRLSLDGKSQAEILEQFPALHAEDVHQAMGYAINDTIRTVEYSSNDGRTPITPILGFIDLILSPDKYSHVTKKISLTKEQKQTLEVAYLTAKKARHEWDKLRMRMSLNFRNITFEQVQVSEMLKHLINQDLYYSYQVDSHLGQEVKIKGIFHLRQILSFLVEEFAHITNVQIVIQETKSQVTFNIVVEGQLMERIELVSQSYFTIGMAAQALYLSGSELKVTQDSDKVIFEFELPIFDDKV